MPTILVSGAANGLGAAFVDAYASLPRTKVLAIDRKPTDFGRANVSSHVVDVISEESIQSLSQALYGEPIDILIHSAGIRGLVPSIEDANPDDVAACETLSVMDLPTLMNTFHINAAGTFLLIRALLPNLERSSNPKAVIMSSRMGSIGNNEQAKHQAAGSAYAYRASKAALNTIVRSLAVDLPQVTFLLVHPGRVETKLVRCKEEGAITAEESVKTMLPLIDRWGPTESGTFVDRFGDTIEW